MSGIRCDRERTIAVRRDRARVVAFLAAALAAGGPRVYREAPRGHFAGALHPMKKFRSGAQRGRKTKKVTAARRLRRIAKDSRRRNRRGR